MGRIAVTGASGFIGRSVVKALLDGGAEVLTLGLTQTCDERASFHEVNLHDAAAVDAALAKYQVETLLHLAWYVNPKDYLVSSQNRLWLESSAHLAASAKRFGVRRFIGVGTCFEYDFTREEGVYSETSFCSPHSVYGRSKMAFWRTLQKLEERSRFDVSWLRFFNLYGPYESSGRLVPDVTQKLLRGEKVATSHGMYMRDFMHVADAGRAVALALFSEHVGVLNIGTGKATKVRDLVHILAQACDGVARVEYGAMTPRFDEPEAVVAHVSKLEALGFSPKFTLKTGLLSTVEWYRSRLK